MTDLWHYCCAHSAAGIVKDGVLKPNPAGSGLVWMTDLHPPEREALGLTMLTIKCDRMTHEFKVADDRHVLWWQYARGVFIQAGLEDWVLGLEQAPGAKPHHWFVSELPIPVVLP